ncbi:leucyl/phenylalanyl-tRNA--protein transferase [Sphingosinicella sp. BN140058]|uniref:leucyl/phenylalanyl-tRNA--protein transferase n=1 Tax=Sphingosinicella sp. BN140058 TaxID=1892855 RepID=UPI001010BA1A|nr:leucyl/phenylalanyl-tRNA--protein transferase [Sphingosinicella sp. BN140058]QAY78303.1 leucyl/phenylalanyl-tRNA--protein transferase [Sphingosinicella sp. BN140058]
MALIDPDLLLRAYAIGVFPMSDSRDAAEIFWVEPRKRAILPIEGFRLSRSLRKTLRAGAFEVSRDTAFADVIRLCAGREETWINDEIEQSFVRLHELGYAHSIECRQDGKLVGGLYGVRLGGAFFGESMFSKRTDASKVALAWLVARLKVGGYTLLDCQFMTDHLRSLGAIEISQKDYLALLASALSADGAAAAGVSVVPPGDGAGAAGARRAPPDLGALDRLLADSARTVDSPPSGWVIAQLLGVTS